MIKKITTKELEGVVSEAYNKFKDCTDGLNANYIPYLANINSSLFGISICLPSGEVINCGDTQYVFGIESISKVHTAILAMRQLGAEAIQENVGANATGLPFNSILAILLENDHPSTPLVNAGAIATASLIRPTGDRERKWEMIMKNINELSGSEVVLIDELYKSESDTNYNNKSISWLLKNYGRIYDNPELALDLYTKQCSLGVTCEQLAVAGATIACQGYNPVTKHQLFDSEIAPKITTLIASVGFYENTGDWLFSSGIPAKTGVGGGVMGVMPNAFGIAAFSPKLDKAGNSVRAQKAISHIMNSLGLNVFKGDTITISD